MTRERLTIEKWEDIEGYEGFYQVSNLGRVKSLERITTYLWHGNIVERKEKEKILKTRRNRWGYEVVNLSKEKKQKTYQVHVLVANAFLEKTEVKKQVNHINGDKLNNNLSNLEFVSPKENMAHAKEMGLLGGGGAEPILSKETAKYIRGLYTENEHITQRDLSKVFNVSVGTIWDIINFKTKKYA